MTRPRLGLPSPAPLAGLLVLLLAASACPGLPDPEPPQPDAGLRPDAGPQPDPTRMVALFFANSRLDPEGMRCAEVYRVERTVPEATGLRAILDLLVAGPTDAEAADGHYTSLPAETRVNDVWMEGDTIRADFSFPPLGGSCLVASIRAQIESTLLANAQAAKAVLSVDGQIEDILQP